jgi:putative membrane protein
VQRLSRRRARLGADRDRPTGFQFKLSALACVIVAGRYGAATANKRILLVQVLPAALALVAVLLAR